MLLLFFKNILFSITGIPFKSVKPSKKTRIIKAIPKVSKKPYYDEVDQEALKYMTKLRVEWTKEEDTILLISKVAGSYLCQNSIAIKERKLVKEQ